MPLSQNPKECGWFYHAPAKKEPGKPRVDYPAPSNIPGIGFDDPDLLQRDQVKEMLFKETDSEYIRLAKMGGRKDLLTFNPERYRKKSAGPSGYPRNDWFYLEDNRIEDEEKKTEQAKQWPFLLPEYMVHKNYKPSFEDPNAMPLRSAAPYYTDATSVMREEGRAATDKTVKIAEHRRPGYGVRNKKLSPAAQKPPAREKADKPQDSEPLYGERKVHRPQVIMPTEREEPTSMSKLLAGAYEKQWYSKLAETQQLLPHHYRSADEKPYTDPEAGLIQTASGHKIHGQADMQQGSFQRKRTQEEEEERELFKLNRFKNIPSKLDSHQRPEVLATVK